MRKLPALVSLLLLSSAVFAQTGALNPPSVKNIKRLADGSLAVDVRDLPNAGDGYSSHVRPKLSTSTGIKIPAGFDPRTQSLSPESQVNSLEKAGERVIPTYTVFDEVDRSVQSRSTIAALGANLFGEHVNLYNGQLGFSITDVSLPGNNALPVAFTRTYSIRNNKGYRMDDWAMGDWKIDIPHITTTTPFTWPGYQGKKRCSDTDVSYIVPPTFVSSPPVPHPVYSGYNATYTIGPSQYWHGIHANMPGGGEMLVANGATPKPAGGPFLWSTKEQTYFSCLSSVQNGDTDTDEGFLAVTADGTKYWFNWYASNLDTKLQLWNGYYVDKITQTLYATRIEDRHGNWVNYTYANAKGFPVKLTQISSSDGRNLYITHKPSGVPGLQREYVSTVSDGAHIWKYDYARLNTAYPSLNKVTLPDNTSWDITFTADGAGLSDAVLNYTNKASNEVSRTCEDPGLFLITDRYNYGIIKHPSGTKGVFYVTPRKFGRSGVFKNCYSNVVFFPQAPPDQNATNFLTNNNPLRYPALTMWAKAISGPGLADDLTIYTYEDDPSKIAFALPGSPICQSESCAGRNYTKVQNSDGSWHKFTFGSGFIYDEGKLLRTETGKDAIALKTEVNTYEFANQNTPYPSPFALSPQRSLVSAYEAENILPLKAKTITQDGVSFNSTVNGFDAFARPTSVTKASVLGVSKTDTFTYRDDLNKWVLGQVESMSTAATGDAASSTEVSRTIYDANTSLPLQIYSFGSLQASMVYNPDGTVANVKDANNNVTYLSNYKRGMPQRIDYPDASYETAVVNDFGWVTSVVDERNNTTTYEYDVLGRLTKLTPPTGDTVAWNHTTQSFTQLATAAYGLPIGAWKQTISTGNYRKETYFNSKWQPVVLREYDSTNVLGTQRFTRIGYDSVGRNIFTSYPGKGDLITQGTRTSYDALGRVTQIKQDSELGQLVSTNEYLPGFKIRTTNAKQASSTTSFMAWDSPDNSLPMRVESPEGVLTTFTRNIFGNPLSVTRDSLVDGGQSTTKTYAYDFYQRVCQRTEPETGTTLFNYDEVGNVLWTAPGQTISNPSVCSKILPLDRISRTYDSRHRLKTVDVPNSTNDLSYNYLPGGLLQSVANGGVAWNYSYNKLGLPVTETLSLDGLVKTITHRYNANGTEDQLTLPSNLAVPYSPNALAQPTQAGTFATSASYRSNGALSAFTYGNTIKHSTLPNLRGLPAQRTDSLGTTIIQDERLAYDGNGNVRCIRDNTSGNGGHRDMQYDALDRLTNTFAPNQWWVNASNSYTVLDNINSSTVGNRQNNYSYDSKNRLLQITQPSGVVPPSSGVLAACDNFPQLADIGTLSPEGDGTSPPGGGGTPPGGGGGPPGGGGTQQSVSDTAFNKSNKVNMRNSFVAQPNRLGRFSVGKPQPSIENSNLLSAGPVVLAYQFAYDNNGNTIAGRQAATFDALNRLTEIPGKESYLYDGHGRRVKTTRLSDNKINYSVYGLSGQLMTEDDARTNKKTDYIYLNARLIAQRSAALTGTAAQTTTYANTYLHTDSLGSPVAHTSQAGAVTKIERYTPYGEPSDQAYDQGPGFTGHVTDALTGLTYAQQRYYDPMLGRFLSADPIETDPNSGASFNRYWYGNNNPYKYTDPDGRQSAPSEYNREPVSTTGSPFIDWLLTPSDARGSKSDMMQKQLAVELSHKRSWKENLQLVATAMSLGVRGLPFRGRGAANTSRVVYRVVDDVEMKSISDLGKFTASPNGDSVKRFLGTLADAKALQKKFTEVFGGKQHIVKASVPGDVMSAVSKTKFSDVPGRPMESINVPSELVDRVKIVN